MYRRESFFQGFKAFILDYYTANLGDTYFLWTNLWKTYDDVIFLPHPLPSLFSTAFDDDDDGAQRDIGFVLASFPPSLCSLFAVRCAFSHQRFIFVRGPCDPMILYIYI